MGREKQEEAEVSLGTRGYQVKEEKRTDARLGTRPHPCGERRGQRTQETSNTRLTSLAFILKALRSYARLSRKSSMTS